MPLKKIENFFPEDVYSDAIKTARKLLKVGAHNLSTHFWWDDAIIKDSFPVLIHNVYHNSEIFSKLRESIENNTGLFINEHDIMFYYWTRFAYIPWHTDHDYAGALTVYLNEDWHPDFGGFFLYEDEEEIKAIYPKRNLGLLQSGGIRHGTTPVTLEGKMRISLQVFLDKDKK